MLLSQRYDKNGFIDCFLLVWLNKDWGKDYEIRLEAEREFENCQFSGKDLITVRLKIV